MKLPAGLIDNRIEFFNDPKDVEKAYCLHNGRVTPVNEAPVYILDMIDADMAMHPKKLALLQAMGYQTQEALRVKYCSCLFGSFDNHPDVVDGQLVHTEFWHCPNRTECPASGSLCNPFEVFPGKALTPRQVEIMILIAHGHSDKQIAYQLGIEYETVKVHTRHVREKLGVQGRTDIVKIAHQKNLVA